MYRRAQATDASRLQHRRYASPRAILTILLITAGAISGISAEEIDLETAVALALESNLGLEGELQNVMQKKLIADTWWNRFYPSISARATMARTNEEQEVSGIAPVPESAVIGPSGPTGAFDYVAPFSSEAPRWNLSTALDMRLDLTLQMVPGIRLAKLDYEAGLITMQEARRKVERDVTKQFYQLLLLKEQIELVRQQIDAAEGRYEQALLNYENGLADEYTMLSARVAWENQKPQLTGLEVQYQQQLLTFRNDLGVSLTRDLEPVGEIDPPNLTFTLQEITRDLLEQRLDVQQLEFVGTILEQQYFLTDSNRAPVVSFGWSYDPSFEGDPWEDDLFDGDSWGQRSGAFTITITQPLDPWLPYSRLRNELASVRREQERNRIQRQQALAGAEIEVRSLIRATRAAEQTVGALEFNIDLAERAYELAEIGYENGLRDLLEVQNAEVELQSARFELLKQRKQIMDNLLDLEFALNTTIDEIAD
ncbi:MAG: TolC family protein [Alkalispirochaeta sp.]